MRVHDRYVVSWKQTAPGGKRDSVQLNNMSRVCVTNTHRIVDVEGVVEYKSLPSGLHNVSEDLV